MAIRNWRVSGTFHTIGEVAVIVSAPNWIGGIRKGALAIKRSPVLKGRRIKAAMLTITESDVAPVEVASEQIPLPVAEAPGSAPTGQTPDSTS